MPAPRLEIDLDKIYHNATTLVTRLARRAISITGVTKATLGSVEIGSTMLRAGIAALGDSRIENIRAMRLSDSAPSLKDVPMTLIRSPMLSQAMQTVLYADCSCNTEIAVIEALSLAAGTLNRTHQVVLMVELGDLREGIMPEDLIVTVQEVLDLPNIEISGIGANLACRSGVAPDSTNMNALSRLVDSVETTFGMTLETVSGGNSANLAWALGDEETDTGRINNLRLGEAILLGRETLHRRPIDGLHTDAMTLTAEVIESKLKPAQPTGQIAQTAFGDPAPASNHQGTVRQAILAIGIQDIDPAGLQAPEGVEVVGASSDHLIVQADRTELLVGQEIPFQVKYSALLRAMTSPFVVKVFGDRAAA